MLPADSVTKFRFCVPSSDSSGNKKKKLQIDEGRTDKQTDRLREKCR
jgi:hypothetical protein